MRGITRQTLTLASTLFAAAGLIACGQSRGPSNVDDAAPQACTLDQLSSEQIQAVTRTPPDVPLADLSHYAPRQAARDPAATLNGGDCAGNTDFRFAVGRGDITGPIGANMSGYVDGEQIATGLLDRQYARAFAIQAACGADAAGQNRAMIVQLDLGLAFTAVRQGVLDGIAADAELSSLYSGQNVLLNASHSHATSAGQSHFDAYHVLTNGHDAQAYAAAIDGILAAVRTAHAGLATAAPAPILFNQAELLNGTTNRSLPAFEANPEAERAAFTDTRGEPVTTNRMMSLLRLERGNVPIGMLNLYPIHGTSLWQRNTLLAGDNKGYAAYRFERDFLTANPGFLAGFLQGDEGDASPNLFIPDLSEAELRDLESDGFRNRAGGRTEPENALISGFKQYAHARDLWDTASERLTGGVSAGTLLIDWSQVIVDMPQYPGDYAADLQPAANTTFRTCNPALGISFAGGAEDGRGPTAEGQTCTGADTAAAAQLIADNFEAGMNGALPPGIVVPVGCDNPVYDARNYACHEEKPIIFPLAEPSPFLATQTLEPTTMPVQIVTIGNLAIIALPWEVTTVAGRRIRNAVLDTMQGAGIDYAVISGLSNGFIHYLTTREEYATQQYEGASTVYGPWTQEAVAQELVRLAGQLVAGEPVSSPFADPDFRSQLSSLQNPMMADDGNPAEPFGTVLVQPDPGYQPSDDRVVVRAEFVAGHPRNDMRNGVAPTDGLLQVERQQADGSFVPARSDADWFTRFEYVQSGQPGGGTNRAVVEWILTPEVPPGTYRLRHDGASADGAYFGVTEAFEVLPCAEP